MSRIDAYLAGISTALGNAGDIVPWPLHLAEVAPYYGDIEAVDLFDRLQRMDAAGASDLDIARCFVGASSPKTLLMDLVVGMKVAGIPSADRVWFTERIFDAMTAAEHGDIFCCDGAHRVSSPAVVDETVRGASWVRLEDGRLPFARAALRLSGSAQALVWAQFFYGWTDVGFEIHGPYPTHLDGVPAQLVVRDFVDLRPVPLWPEAAGFAPARMRLLVLHDPDADLAVDLFNHLTNTAALVETALAVALDVDGCAVGGVEEAAAVGRKVVTQLAEQHDAVRALDRPGLVTKFVESRYYALRNWRSGDDWRPPAEVYERISEWPPIELDLDGEQDPAALGVLFDPRNDVLPF